MSIYVCLGVCVCNNMGNHISWHVEVVDQSIGGFLVVHIDAQTSAGGLVQEDGVVPSGALC